MIYYPLRFERPSFEPVEISQADVALSFWCVVRQMPNLQSKVVAKFLSRAEAEAHLQFLKRKRPDLYYEIMFDALSDEAR